MALAILLGCYGCIDSNHLEACSTDDSIALCIADATLSLLTQEEEMIPWWILVNIDGGKVVMKAG